MTLTTEKTKIQEDFTKERAEKEQVITAKTAVESEKAKIEAEKAVLAKKTEIGSVIKVTNISTVGYAVSEKGKEKEKTQAKNIDRLKWCFEALENRVTDGGSETFYIRVIDPTGVAIGTTAGGGGVLKLNDGKEVQYTTIKTMDFKGDPTRDVCITWDSKGNAQLVKGEYTFEIYNKGYLAGRTVFPLK